jgi:hypothetical protein
MSTDWPHTCPFCRLQQEAVTHISGKDYVPSNGDITMCFNCGGISVFTNDGGLRKPTKKEQRELDQNSRIKEVKDAWKMAKQGSLKQ